MFCRLCAERALEKHERCPLCRQEAKLETLQAQHLVNMRVNSLTVCCERKCGWYGRCDARRAHAKVCPVARVEFSAHFRGDAGWTLEETCDHQLVVVSLCVGGAAADYNERQGLSPTRMVRLGCVIAGVNGTRGDCNELQYLLQKSACSPDGYSVVFKQPTEFCITVVRKSRCLGLELGLTQADSFLEIRAVMPDGAVMDHNRSNSRERLKSRDRILEVNGVHGSGRELLRCIAQNTDACTMRICRLP